ncbi:MAG: hypothetical protein ACI9U2_004613, partial [Bradymonadia bacterium]
SEERTFSLAPADEGTQFETREVFSGPMLGLIKKSMPDINEALAALCAGLKSHAEGTA